MYVEYFLTSDQSTRSFVIAFWKPPSLFAGFLLIGEYGESKKKSQSVIPVGTANNQLRICNILGSFIQSIGGCLDLKMTIVTSGVYVEYELHLFDQELCVLKQGGGQGAVHQL
jgi:hypothetical protein